ncbi:alpha-hydroxy acid oxidase [Frigidibacter sp. ROC022]|uniref:alpha-hydroxy acid oxidase n=1 Tax=Frigidibacter sp. ROC022 TaxID=2971796 RepID=UPI00215A38FD|nr:alpha-hydroxy acid oxidase [Frigidibacter sp. ROC022]MCR8725209.1 alpha-hydroxy-acid oxidizing protein [Frigidibacter sp. ROC022]
MDLDTRYPALSDLRARARRRIPHFMWEYLDSATGTETGMVRNRAALDRVLFLPQVLKGEVTADLSVELLGCKQGLPFGIAPVGMSGAMWPGAERILAELGARHAIPYAMSTMATRAPEDVADVVGDQGWFQLYPPRDPAVRADMLARIKGAGFHTLVLTVDVPASSRRERQIRGGLTHPPQITPRTLWHIAQCPAWALGTARLGMPKMRFIERYSEHKGALPSTAHIGYLMRIAPEWDYVEMLREEWSGKFVVKGVLDPEVSLRLKDAGVDAVWVSNHAARQFDGAPAALDCLPGIRAAVGPEYPLIYDSGIEGGLDILRAIAMGADFVFLGKAFHYALGALGAAGAEHLVQMLTADLRANLGQLAAEKPADVRKAVVSGV